MSEGEPTETESVAQMEALRQARSIAGRPERGWLRSVRSALGRSQAAVAARISMTRQAYADLEAAEERGAISLNSLRRAAEAMECDLAYFVVPRAEMPATSESESVTGA